MGSKRKNVRQVVAPKDWRDLAGARVCALPGRGTLISHPRSAAALLWQTGQDSAREITLPDHADLKVVDASHVSVLRGDRQTVGLFSLEARAMVSETQLPFAVPSSLYLSGQWIAARLTGDSLFHCVGEKGELLGSFGSVREADESPAKSWAGTIQQPIAMSGTIEKLGPTSFAFVYDAIPLVQAYETSGAHLWTAILRDVQVPSAASLEMRLKDIQERNPPMKVVEGMIFPINAAVAIGRCVAVLHQPAEGADDRSLSLIGLSGGWLGAIRVKRDSIGITWEGDQLVTMRATQSSELLLEELETGRALQ